jgi:[ribosomal protein S18]-alanine N-acetyltransferase
VPVDGLGAAAMTAAWRRDELGAQPEFRLRSMERSDLHQVLALEKRLFPDDAWSPGMFAEEVSQPATSRIYLVAESGTGVVGYAGMLFPGGPEADVLTIAVHPDHWGKGIGSVLLAALIDEAARRGCGAVFLEVREDNPRARTLYRNRGFTEIGIRKGYYQPSGVDAVVMRKELK